MRILVDISHPAHVHFFKNAASIWRERGHEVCIAARDKDVSLELMDRLGWEYHLLSKVGSGGTGLMKELVIHQWRLFKLMRKFRPDVVLEIGGTFIVHVCKLMRIPTIVFTDTEIAYKSNRITFPFADLICTPSCYLDDIGKKHMRYDGYHELAYLHPKYFEPDPTVLELLGVDKDEKFAIVRFVGWGAGHDLGHNGLSLEMKIRAVDEFSKHAKVFVSSESDLPERLVKHRIEIPVERMHDALYYASLLYGESSTMASECAILGTPAVFLYDGGRGYTSEQEKLYGSVFNFSASLEDQEKSIAKGLELLMMDDAKKAWEAKRESLLQDKVDVTSWLVDLVENYSERIKC